MALFKISKGLKANLPSAKAAGNCWYTIDDSLFYIDYEDEKGEVQRKALNAKDAETLCGASLAKILDSNELEIPTSKAVLDAIDNLAEGFSDVIYQMYGNDLTDDGAPTIRQIANDEANAVREYLTDEFNDAIIGLEADFNESIIGLSVDGTTVTYIKGDGSTHTFETQDTNTTYSLATDEITGLTKLYATTGSAEDGTMTQKAIKTELDKKVGVSIDDTNDMLIFTI